MPRFARPIRAAIVDLDGTMLDTVPDFYVAINRMRADLGLHEPVTHEQVLRVFDENNERLRELLFAVIPKIGPQPEDVCATALRDARAD